MGGNSCEAESAGSFGLRRKVMELGKTSEGQRECIVCGEIVRGNTKVSWCLEPNGPV